MPPFMRPAEFRLIWRIRTFGRKADLTAPLKHGRDAHATTAGFLISDTSNLCVILVSQLLRFRSVGVEPTTCGLQNRCSSMELGRLAT